ncbi:hypothetical protein CAPTEDRAFT_195977 [Capitella teleta]|uniref:BZIP domain-containing protein n=1 Tax=Capitella teleta TaxID=283909 RepID=R7TI69_CAPTE|nr:hypothetical protein CAPTEDRAFT_195977 [Capitella teleta]|eukprot:ELT91236.1 hypothetical protein CAPTEDRAFT_195977 [Capitella teleta]
MSQRNNLRAPPSPMTSWVLFPPTPACSTEPDEVTLPPSTPLNVTVPDSPFSSCGGDPSFTSFTDSFGIPPTPSSMTSFVAGSPDSLPDEESVFFPDALLAAGEPSNVGNQELPDLGHLDLSNLVKEELKNTIQKRRREGGLEEIDLTSQDFQPKKKTEPRESKISQLDDDRRLRRRESNRRAAAKSRKKKKCAANGLVNEVGRLEAENLDLRNVVKGLEGDFHKLQQYLRDHMAVCPLAHTKEQKVSTSSATAHPPLSPVNREQALIPDLPPELLEVILQCDSI